MPSTCRHCQKRKVFLYATAVVISVSVKYSPERYGIALKYQGNEERNGDGDKDKDKERRQRRKRKEGRRKEEGKESRETKKEEKKNVLHTYIFSPHKSGLLSSLSDNGRLPRPSMLFFSRKMGTGTPSGHRSKKHNRRNFFFFPKQKSGTRPHNVGTILYILLLDALLTPIVPALPRDASEAPDALLKCCISSTSPLVRYHMPSMQPM